MKQTAILACVLVATLCVMLLSRPLSPPVVLRPRQDPIANLYGVPELMGTPIETHIEIPVESGEAAEFIHAADHMRGRAHITNQPEQRLRGFDIELDGLNDTF